MAMVSITANKQKPPHFGKMSRNCMTNGERRSEVGNGRRVLCCNLCPARSRGTSTRDKEYKEELEVCIVIVTKPYVSRVLYFFVNGYDSREMSNSINNGFV